MNHDVLVRHGSTLRIGSSPTRLPGSGAALIELSFVGVCGTDLQILNGTRADTAEILGHEGAGTVVSAGGDCALQPGQSVVFNPAARLNEGRILGHNVPGIFQRLYLAEATDVAGGVVLPVGQQAHGISSALVEPLGVIVYAHELISRVTPDLRCAVVFGAGPVGLLAAIYLRALGIRVTMVHSSRARLGLAVQLGLIEPEAVLPIHDGQQFDAALICTTREGAPSALERAAELVRDGGCIDFITNYPEQGTTPAGLSANAIRAVRAANVCGLPGDGEYLKADLRGRRIACTGHRGTSREHLLQAIRVLSQHRRYESVITHRLSLHEAASAIQTLAMSHDRTLEGRDCIKAVIDMTRRSV